MARLWTPRVSPRHNYKFEGWSFFTGLETEHPWWLPLDGSGDIRTNRQTDRWTTLSHKDPAMWRDITNGDNS